MIIAIKILENELKDQIEDMRINKIMMNDISNSKEMNEYLNELITENKEAIQSIQKAIDVLKKNMHM